MFLTVLWMLRMSETNLGLHRVGCSRCGDQRRRTTCHEMKSACVRGTWSFPSQFPLSADLIPGRRSTLGWQSSDRYSGARSLTVCQRRQTVGIQRKVGHLRSHASKPEEYQTQYAQHAANSDHHCAPSAEAVTTALHRSRSCASVRASLCPCKLDVAMTVVDDPGVSSMSNLVVWGS